MKEFFDKLHLFLANCKGEVYSFINYHGYRMRIPLRVRSLRHKKQIRVLFVVSEVSMWKTETLYQRMLEHPRFNPLLLPVSDCVNIESDLLVEAYFKEKGYAYYKVHNIQEELSPDIIFYQQAYPGYIDEVFFEQKNRRSLFCFVNYCFRNTISSSTVNLPLLNLAWKVFSENEVTSEELKPLMRNHGCNLVNTGLPIMDELDRPSDMFKDPWKQLHRKTKRIIYAPHHSILAEDKLAWGSILEYGDFILYLASKYREQTQWVFKPHPFLKEKLKRIWGVKRTEEYYNSWETLENSQIEEGSYLDVFKHSDAMIHDCGSFMIEYHYTHNPVMYLYSSRPQKDIGLSKFSIEARKLHYPARNLHDVELFVRNVIDGIDSLKMERINFYTDYLKPNEKSVCGSIINEILGE